MRDKMTGPPCSKCGGRTIYSNRRGVCNKCQTGCDLSPDGALARLMGVKRRYITARGGVERLNRMSPEARAVILKPDVRGHKHG